MSNVKIIQEDNQTIIPDPEFIDCLCNTNEVAVDGEVYENVVQVTFEQ